jgi:hypothetical protein
MARWQDWYDERCDTVDAVLKSPIHSKYAVCLSYIEQLARSLEPECDQDRTVAYRSKSKMGKLLISLKQEHIISKKRLNFIFEVPRKVKFALLKDASSTGAYLDFVCFLLAEKHLGSGMLNETGSCPVHWRNSETSLM